MQGHVTLGTGLNLLSNHALERNSNTTVYVGNIDVRADDGIISELFSQAGPVAHVHIPRDRVTGIRQGYGFVEFRSREDAEYAVKILNMIRLYGRPLRVNMTLSDTVKNDGAKIFIRNLDQNIDEKVLFETFSSFGTITDTPKLIKDVGNTYKGHGFISFANFEAADAAINAMNGQYLMNRKITVQYAFKEEIPGEYHGTATERQLAMQHQNCNGK